jgi:hypothetical protein
VLRRLRDSILVLVVPILALWLLGLATGSEDLGSRSLAVLYVAWAIGLGWVWWPRRRAR